MKAIFVDKNISGNYIRIKRIPIPDILNNEILIKVKAVGLNPVDWKGIEYNIFKKPYILGSDFSGVAVKVGKKIKKYKKGDKVIGSLEWLKQGACAEYIVTKEMYIYKKPLNISLLKSASIPLASLTAWQSLFKELNLKKGQKIFITAGAGGVGLFAIQFAKWKGAYVYTSASKKNHKFLYNIGADEILDYTNTSSFNKIKDLDCVLDSVSMKSTLFKVLKKGGKYLSINGKPTSEDLEGYDILAKHFLFHSDSKDLGQIVKLIGKGTIKVVVDKYFNIKHFKKALKYQKKGHSKGKNILLIDF
ncbi:MAG: NADP-dependent oxidoreductase [Candidatus Pacebacteria bacterium]|nr:NADP-dependent oxidoreductase [Candidatus Paceibacterota bacterium]MCF7862905.1 NADP-dependent oxidoreductase [Candidatus Paceibacterota bacterium]